jgi:hypothetical protein
MKAARCAQNDKQVFPAIDINFKFWTFGNQISFTLMIGDVNNTKRNITVK